MASADGAVRLAGPLSREELDRAFERFGVPESGRRLVLAALAGDPVRRVGGGGRNVVVRCNSRKMGCVVQAESRSVELPFVYRCEFDPHVLPHLCPPARLHVRLRDSRGRSRLRPYVPDFLVYDDRTGFRFAECKPVSALEADQAKPSPKFAHGEDGRWTFPARTVTVEAGTPEDACARAVERADAGEGWTALDPRGPTFVAAVAEGARAAPRGPDAAPVPAPFTERGGDRGGRRLRRSAIPVPAARRRGPPARLPPGRLRVRRPGAGAHRGRRLSRRPRSARERAAVRPSPPGPAAGAGRLFPYEETAMPAVEPAAPDGEAHAWETAHGAAPETAPARPGNGHDPGALPAFLRRTA